MLKKSTQKKLENSFKWEKRLVDKAIEQIILGKAEEIVNVQILAATQGNLQAGQYLIDRTFGKARQNIGLDGGAEGAPIIIMPASLVNKFALDKPLPLKTQILQETIESPTNITHNKDQLLETT